MSGDAGARCRWAGALMHWYTGDCDAGVLVLVHWYTGTPVHWCTGDAGAGW